jgi:hypothetical protein
LDLVTYKNRFVYEEHKLSKHGRRAIARFGLLTTLQHAIRDAICGGNLHGDMLLLKKVVHSAGTGSSLDDFCCELCEIITRSTDGCAADLQVLDHLLHFKDPFFRNADFLVAVFESRELDETGTKAMVDLLVGHPSNYRDKHPYWSNMRRVFQKLMAQTPPKTYVLPMLLKGPVHILDYVGVLFQALADCSRKDPAIVMEWVHVLQASGVDVGTIAWEASKAGLGCVLHELAARGQFPDPWPSEFVKHAVDSKDVAYLLDVAKHVHEYPRTAASSLLTCTVRADMQEALMDVFGAQPQPVAARRLLLEFQNHFPVRHSNRFFTIPVIQSLDVLKLWVRRAPWIVQEAAEDQDLARASSHQHSHFIEALASWGWVPTCRHWARLMTMLPSNILCFHLGRLIRQEEGTIVDVDVEEVVRQRTDCFGAQPGAFAPLEQRLLAWQLHAGSWTKLGAAWVASAVRSVCSAAPS